MDCVICIQSCWRSKKCRKKVKLFSRLPDELWYMVLDYIRNDNLFKILDRIILIRVTRLYWILPRKQIKLKFQTLLLIRKYVKYLSETTITSCIIFSLRMLRHLSHVDQRHYMLINATIEVLLLNKCKKSSTIENETRIHVSY